MDFGSGWMLILGLALASLAMAAAIWRRMPWPLVLLLTPGFLLLALAAAGMRWQRPAPGSVAVMIDLSPSTRQAAYRDPAWLKHRLAQLLPHGPHRLVFFADHNEPIPQLPDRPFNDRSCERTIYAPPPDASAVILFSDGRMSMPPAAPPTYCVIDPSLEQAARHDSAVTDLRMENGRPVAFVRGQAVLEGDSWKPQGPPSPEGRAFVSSSRETRVVARLDGNDPWPENDQLSIPRAPRWAMQRWWVGPDAPPGWVAMPAARLPIEPAAWLAPSVVLLNDVPAADLSAPQQNRLEQYVRDLGGALILAGARHTLTADASPESLLRRLSPLSGDPPRPTRRWVFLTDASGSMNEHADGSSRWQRACDALRSALTAVAANDRVDIGGFAAAVDWWARDLQADQARHARWPPPHVLPHGPTNLEKALHTLAEMPPYANALPTEVVILTDAQADLTQPALLANRMRQHHMRLWVLATGRGRALDALSQMAEQTGGQLRINQPVNQWDSGMRRLAHAARGPILHQTPVSIQFSGKLRPLGRREVSPWQAAWVKQQALELSMPNRSAAPSPRIARWQFGAGQVVGASFSLTDREADLLARQIAARPGDPRLTVSWTTGKRLAVRVDAEDSGHWLNDLKLTLTLHRPGDASGRTYSLPQTAPGLYERTLPAPRHGSIATILHGVQTVDRTIVPGRYAPEFDAVGIDRHALGRLAAASDGAVIGVRDDRPLDLLRPRQNRDLSPWLAMGAAVFLAAGLVCWKKM